MDGEREQVRCGAKLPHDPHGWPGMFGGQSLLCDGGYRLCGASTIAAVTHPGHFWGTEHDGPHWCAGWEEREVSHPICT